VNGLNFFGVVFGERLTVCRVLDEEGVMRVTCRMALWLEERIEVPEGALDESVRRHLREAHSKENLLELLSNQ